MYRTKGITVPFKNPASFACALVYIFGATAVFSLSFLLPYGWGSLARWGVAIGAGAALSWVFFILLLARLSGLTLLDVVRVCARTMVAGNTILLSSVLLNVVAFLYAWLPPFVLHILIIGVANIVMFITFSGLTANMFSLSKRAGLWFIGLNGTFGLILTAARIMWIQ